MIALGCDHGGFLLKEEIKKYLDEAGVSYKDFGIYEEKSMKYPDKAFEVCHEVVAGNYDKAILICGTGIGISIAANKVKGIRAAVCSDAYSASMTRRHNNSNILAFGSRVVGQGTAETIVDAFFGAEYEGGRHQTRVDMISDIEEGKL